MTGARKSQLAEVTTVATRRERSVVQGTCLLVGPDIPSRRFPSTHFQKEIFHSQWPFQVAPGARAIRPTIIRNSFAGDKASSIIGGFCTSGILPCKKIRDAGGGGRS